MAWTIELSPRARKELSKFPKDHQQQIGHGIDRMKDDPFQGDVSSLKGKKWKGRYRKVIGRYRVFFILYHEKSHVEVSSIRLRTEKTYR